MIVPLVACGVDDGDPAAVLAEYIDGYNAHDLDAVLALFSDDAVMTHHPIDDDSPARRPSSNSSRSTSMRFLQARSWNETNRFATTMSL